MSFFNRLMHQTDVPAPISPYGQRIHVNVDSDPESERNFGGPGSLLSYIATSGEDDSSLDDRDLLIHDIAAHLPPEMSAVTADGYMDNHRTPIVSINGKDVNEHKERRGHAA